MRRAAASEGASAKAADCVRGTRKWRCRRGGGNNLLSFMLAQHNGSSACVFLFPFPFPIPFSCTCNAEMRQ